MFTSRTAAIAGVFFLLAGEGKAGRLRIEAGRNADVIPVHEVVELDFLHSSAAYGNPFLDVVINVEFRAPSGRRYSVGGFHYGSPKPATIVVRQLRSGNRERRMPTYHFDGNTLWKARFAPGEEGKWKYRWSMKDSSGGSASGRGRFRCVTGKNPLPGFVRINPGNPFRFVYDNGEPFFPVGIQECLGDGYGTGSVLSNLSMEGPFRTDHAAERPKLPSGSMFVRGPSGNPINGDVYFGAMARCGFNFFRFSQANCSFKLYDHLDSYAIQESIMVDELLRHVRKYGFRVFYGIFGYQPVFGKETADAAAMEKVKRFIKYSVDRWGAYVDFWEFVNEQKVDTGWYEIMSPYLKAVDPYAHPVATSWERPELPGIDINAPHWYQRLDATSRRKDRGILLDTDRETAEKAKEWKKHGKNVVVGEAGNYVDPRALKDGKVRPGVGGVWDPDSALRMRIRNWTGFFSEISYIFWVTSYARDGHFMNMWIGPREREYVAAMQDFCSRLDRDIAVVPVTVSEPETVRGYGLASDRRAAVYLHHFAGHRDPVRDMTVRLNIPASATGYWYSPVNASILRTVAVEPGETELPVPPFSVDIALLVTPGPAPDIDRDGQDNNADQDDDNDGVPDGEDAFPLDPLESADADADLIGDNLDADDDADGRGDDHNRNGKPDHDEQDLDGDGVPRSGAIPWDAFPFDPNESSDTDGDGVGDNADLDDDGDGYSDEEEKKAGTDPASGTSFPWK